MSAPEIAVIGLNKWATNLMSMPDHKCIEDTIEDTVHGQDITLDQWQLPAVVWSEAIDHIKYHPVSGDAYLFIGLKDQNGNWIEQSRWTDQEIEKYFQKNT